MACIFTYIYLKYAFLPMYLGIETGMLWPLKQVYPWNVIQWEIELRRMLSERRHTSPEAVGDVVSANGGWKQMCINQSTYKTREVGGHLATTVTDVFVKFAGVELPLH